MCLLREGSPPSLSLFNKKSTVHKRTPRNPSPAISYSFLRHPIQRTRRGRTQQLNTRILRMDLCIYAHIYTYTNTRIHLYGERPFCPHSSMHAFARTGHGEGYVYEYSLAQPGGLEDTGEACLPGCSEWGAKTSAGVSGGNTLLGRALLLQLVIHRKESLSV